MFFVARPENGYFAIHECRNFGVGGSQIDAENQIVRFVPRFTHCNVLFNLHLAALATFTWAVR